MSFFRKSNVPASLRVSDLGQDLPRNELRQLEQTATLLTIDDGYEIIAESTPGRECFVIVDGEFEVNGPAVSTRVGAGEVTGELALLTGRQRNASVVASGDGAVYVMHPREFATLLSEAPRFCSQVVTNASARLGSEPVSLPAQYVRRTKTERPVQPHWSQRMSDVGAWPRRP